jgi:hypothetical protein
LRPPAIASTPVSVPTRTGVLRLVVVPSPSAPVSLSPHAAAQPLARIA